MKVGINRAYKIAGKDAMGVQGRPSEGEPVGKVGLEEATDGGVCAGNHVTEGSEEVPSSEDAHVGPTGSKGVLLKATGDASSPLGFGERCALGESLALRRKLHYITWGLFQLYISLTWLKTE